MTDSPPAKAAPDAGLDAYTARVGMAHRRSFGQFFTPPEVARFMTRWVLGAGSTTLFDPAFGLGAFRDALPDAAAIDFSASEVDAAAVRHWRASRGESGRFIAVEDYLLAWGRRHANIVCNPPYMRFQKFRNRQAVRAAFARNLGVRLSGYTNTACAFLLKSLAELAPAGRLAYLMPLEFLATGYGAAIKARLLAGGHLFALARLDCERRLFPEATTSVGLVLYDAAAVHQSVRFHNIEHIDALEDFAALRPTATVARRRLDPAAKWLPHFRARQAPAASAVAAPLGAYGKFSRGIATGANAFFVLRPSAAAARGLNPQVDCVPCIARSAQVRGAVFDAAAHAALRAADQPTLLFSPPRRRSAQVAAYLEQGERAGVHQRHLTSRRSPWHKMETRPPARLLLGVFARGAHKVVLNASGARHLTCFHGFVGNALGAKFEDHLFLYFRSRVGLRMTALARREYGNGLRKLEPADLSGVPVPAPGLLATVSAAQVAAAIDEARRGGAVPAWLEERFAPVLAVP